MASAGAGQDAPKVKIGDLAFMSGSWECDLFGGKFHESWTQPVAGTMLGGGRFLMEGELVNCELMSIEEIDGKLALYVMLGRPSEGEKTPVKFTLTAFEGGKATFHNPDNDMPDTIEYWKKPGGLGCAIEGDEAGKRERIEFPFVRAAQ